MSNQLKGNLPGAKYNLTNVFILSSKFIKGEITNLDKLKMSFSLDSFHGEENDFYVQENITLRSEDTDFLFEVVMEAQFSKMPEDQFPKENFEYLNAAPIIYGYIRQHISYTTLTAGMKPITLPLVNFYDYYKNNIEGK